MTRGELIRDPTVAALPVIFLWPHSGCNCRCVMCDIWKDKSRREISLESIAAWLPEWRSLGVQHVALTGGEAQLHSGIWSLCRMLREAGLKVLMLSAGITLNRHAKELVETCDCLILSIDGPPEVHNTVRGLPRAFDKLERTLCAVKAQDPHFPVSARSTVNRHNAALLPETALTAKRIGVDRLSFLATDLTSEAFSRDNSSVKSMRANLALDDAGLAQLEAALARLSDAHSDLFDSGFLAESREELHRRLVLYFKAMLSSAPFPRNTCNAPWTTAVIEPDGAVRPCFFQPAYGRIGPHGSLAQVINSEQAISWRSKLDVTQNSICQRCVCTFQVHRCACGLSRGLPYCDNTCQWSALLTMELWGSGLSPALERSDAC